MAVLKNSKWERFAQELAKGKTADEAYEAAGYAANRGNAARLKANESILKRIGELQQRGAERATVTLESLIQEAADIQTKALTAGQFGPAVTALTAKAKLAGLWIEKRENTNRTIDASRLSDADLAEIATGGGGEDVADASERPAVTH
jgi:phage terminase small subunit